MPVPAVNSQMVQLETAIDSTREDELFVQMYSKTRNGLKELVYYIGDRNEFMRAFNEALAGRRDTPRNRIFRRF